MKSATTYRFSNSSLPSDDKNVTKFSLKIKKKRSLGSRTLNLQKGKWKREMFMLI
jgi:hypothetical protein